MRDIAPRRLAVIFAVVAVLLGLGFRYLVVESFGFAAGDLVRYEDMPYGVDLPDAYGNRPYLLAWSRGDGQAYVTLAADPWAQGPVRELGSTLYRYSRVGYAWLARVFALGQVAWIPMGLLAVNIASLAALGWIAGSKYRSWGGRSILLLLVPGVLVSFSTDTAEALGMTSTAIALVASGSLVGGVSGAFLGLVRPEFGMVLLLRGSRGAVRLAGCAATALSLQVIGLMGLGFPWEAANGTLSWPALGYLTVLADAGRGAFVATLGLFFAGVATAAIGVIREVRWRRVAFVIGGGFVLCLTPLVLSNPMNSLRAVSYLSLLWAVPGGAFSDLEQEAGSASMRRPPASRAPGDPLGSR